MATLLSLDPYATDWLNLLARWLHVIAGIVWIGTVGCRGPSAWWSHAALFASRFGSATVHFSP